jgi:hypothetical protein
MMRRKQIDYAQSGWDASIPDAQVCMKVDAAGCKQVLESTLMAPWLPAR